MIPSLFVALALNASASMPCAPSPGASQELVRRFYTTALVERKVREGFERDVSPAFVEHKPDIASSDRSGAVSFLEGLIAELPLARWELLRVTGDANLVAVHARFTPAPGAPSYAIADFFRIEQCRIVEHWDVVAGPPMDAVNPLPRF
jgi:predicted SnoaL-like aldol condensation-catalyzing enzyme